MSRLDINYRARDILELKNLIVNVFHIHIQAFLISDMIVYYSLMSDNLLLHYH